MKHWDILGIEPTNDRRKIKRAYARLLGQFHPEDDPKGFMRLREAFETALSASEWVSSESEFESSTTGEPTETTDALLVGQPPQDDFQPDPFGVFPEEVLRSPEDSEGGIADSQSEHSQPVVEAQIAPSPVVNEALERIAGYSEVTAHDIEDAEKDYPSFYEEADALMHQAKEAWEDGADLQRWQELLRLPVLRNQAVRGSLADYLMDAIVDDIEQSKLPDIDVLAHLVKFASDAWLSDVNMGEGRHTPLLVEMNPTIDGCIENRQHFLSGTAAFGRYLRRFLFSPAGRLTQLSFCLYFASLITLLTMVLFAEILPLSEARQVRAQQLEAKLFSRYEQLDEFDELLDKSTIGFPLSLLGEQGTRDVSMISDATRFKLRLHRLSLLDELDEIRDELKVTEATTLVMRTNIVVVAFLSLVLAYSFVCVSIKRQHDLGRSGSMLVFAIVLPWMLPFYLLAFFLGGRDEDNDYGPRPLYLLTRRGLRCSLKALIDQHS